MTRRDGTPPLEDGSATAASPIVAPLDPPSSLLHEAPLYRGVVAVASVSVGVLAVLLLRWNLDLSGDPDFTGTKEFGLWSLMVGIETAVWLVVGSALLSQYGLARTSAAVLVRNPAQLTRMRKRSVLFATFIVVALILPSTAGLMLGLQSQSPLWGHQWKSTLITIIGIGSALPGALCLSMYHDLVKSDASWPTGNSAQETAWFDFLRGRLKTVIALLSLQIALLVFVNSLLRRALDSSPSTEGSLPSQLVLAYAGLFSAVLVATFMYVRSPLHARAERLVDSLSRIMPDHSEASKLADAFKLRSQLRSYFALDRSVRGDLEEVGLVAFPVLTAFFSETVGIALGG